jgi:CheY-like chemotaxis protein
MALRCLIVDDNAHFLKAASSLLGCEGIAVVGVASSGTEAVQKVEELRPDVTLVDLELGPESGFEVARRLHREEDVSPAVILISTYAETDFSDLIDASPALGFVSKSDLSAKAICELLDGSVEVR